VHRIVGEARGIVAVGVAAGNPVDALTEELDRVVIDLSGLPFVAKAGSEGIGQAQALIGRFEQDRAAVGAAVLLVECDDKGFVEEIRKQDRLLRGRVRQAKASGVWKDVLAHTFYHMGAFVFSEFVHFPG
jgi:hypothetical protein